MLHPLVSTLIQRPDLIVDHVAAYAALFQEEATEVGQELMRRAVAWMLAVLSIMVFLSLAGTAFMLGMLQQQFHWALVVVPGLALIFAIAAFWFAKKPISQNRFPDLKAQIASDAIALRSVA
jgi:peptidoglycan/LPS O-acetylase OafA/YrhL